MLTIQDFFDFYSYFGFYVANNEIFKTILAQVLDLNQLQQQFPQYGTPPKSVKQQQLNDSPEQQNLIDNSKNYVIVEFFTFQRYTCKILSITVFTIKGTIICFKIGQISLIQHIINIIYIQIGQFNSILISRGESGFTSFYRVSKIQDADMMGCQIQQNLQKLLEIIKQKLQILKLLDLQGFKFVLRGEMPQQRTQLIKQLFENYQTNDYVTLSTLRNKFHLQVPPRYKKWQQKRCGNHLQNINGGFGHENITKEELLEFFSNYSASIPDEKYFEQIIVNVFRLLQDESKNHQAGNHKRSYLQDHHSYVLQRGIVSANAPFGTFTQQEQLAQSRPYVGYNQPASFNIFKPLDDVKKKRLIKMDLKFNKFHFPNLRFHYNLSNNMKIKKKKLDGANILRNKISQRGLRGLINIQYRFQLYDKSHLNALSYQEWKNCFKQWRLEVSDQILDEVFQQFQTNGMMNYRGFVKQMQGTMSLRKFNSVQEAFESLPKATIDIVKQQFNAKDHPDARANRKREDDVLCEFIDTYEQYHIVYTGGDYVKNSNITFEEVIGYHYNLNLLFKDDIQFQQYVQSVWNLRRQF
ncbi:unnamed protein product (macronuclear) [Paramecium tetraurelia]|uniref:EF-hand domain-containing protein n=1 Tax=Paramecium tetraurelia TaxID=5888 RepID=A0DB18_PARTE|nr:uncharacterized protein GSPATT00015129001 [Paramecium tetraurelia]CAK80235.1 unnamed protein product [Paramecium tetraurelia]|eukprot:XP_001447632.1 hypothetical protein (macronuclear) [Paramecium tetraurelia strain d4-2]